MNNNIEEQRLDLLCKQAVYGLTESEQRQLDELTKDANGSMDSQSLELTAAAISMVGLEIEPMPAHLESKVLARVQQHIATEAAAASAAAEDNVFTRPRVEPVAQKDGSGWSLWNWLPWAIAAAACIALIVNVYQTRTDTQIAQTPQPAPSPERALTPAEERQRFIETHPNAVRAEWSKGNVEDIESIQGDVVWSDADQKGYMRFRGLPKNNASAETYQLWIFEENQGEKTPIDGGTFDVSADGEVIIPIDAKLKAKNPSLFAVTVEKPGGVVVSKREKIAALAKIET